MDNEGYLKGMRCPKCGSYGPFIIEMVGNGLVYDDSIDYSYDFTWDGTNYCTCKACGFDAFVRDFKEEA